MALMDFLLMKRSLDRFGVDRSALFADPAQYLSRNPVVLTARKPYSLFILLVFFAPLITFAVTFGLDQPWEMPTVATLGVSVLLVLPGILINNQEECIIDEKGITLSMRGRTVKAPWVFFNQPGTSNLSPGHYIKIPINLDHRKDLKLLQKDGSSIEGSAVKASHFRISEKDEKVNLRNYYRLGATDLAELIRRVALTLGHQEEESEVETKEAAI